MKNNYTLVRNYSDNDLIDRMRSLSSFKYVPSGIHLIAVRANEPGTGIYCDKIYVFEEEKGISVMPCTTKSGRWGLINFWKYNRDGVAVIKDDEIYYDTYKKSNGITVRHHNNKVQCLRQIKDMLYYRDGNQNDIVEEQGEIYEGNYSTNIHPNSYNQKRGILSWFIGKWSLGCIVINDLSKYWNMLNLIDDGEPITLTVLKEF